MDERAAAGTVRILRIIIEGGCQQRNKRIRYIHMFITMLRSKILNIAGIELVVNETRK